MQFKVGDKVQIEAPWVKDYKYGVVVGFPYKDMLECDWILKEDDSVHRAAYPIGRHYLLKPKKKGLCAFLDKVTKEYS
jgi:hypothetical protein